MAVKRGSSGRFVKNNKDRHCTLLLMTNSDHSKLHHAIRRGGE